MLRVRTVLIIAATCLLAGSAFLWNSLPDDTPDTTIVAYEGGGAAAPPLPVAAPAVGFDPAISIADTDASVLVTVDSTGLRFDDGSTGETIRVGPASPAAELRAVSATGELAALLERRGGDSIITVASINHRIADRTYTFPGLIEPEAFATDATLLYVIDHQASATPGAYRVRPLDLATGELGVMLGPTKVPIPEEMNGSGRRQIWSPDGDRLYTLYIRQAVHNHGGQHTDGFVHVLDLTEEWAHCLDLPTGFGTGELSETAIALDPGGGELAVLDLHAGKLAWASTTDLAIMSSIDVPAGLVVDGAVHLAVTEQLLAIGWSTEVHWFDRDTFTEVGEPEHLLAPLDGLTGFGTTVLAWAGSPHELTQPKLVE